LETELKLRFSSREEMLNLCDQEWFASILLPNSEKTFFYDTKYFDTKDQILRSLQTSIRVREIRDSDYIHTVKIGGSSQDGLHQRFEWNLETIDNQFDAETFLQNAISDGDPPELLSDVLKKCSDFELISLCSTSFERTLFLAGYGDSLLEICFDYGNLFAPDKEDRVCEMEIELKQGDVRDVLSLGEEILLHTAAVRDNRGKYAKCLALLDEKFI
jgi:triphosphatase